MITYIDNHIINLNNITSISLNPPSFRLNHDELYLYYSFDVHTTNNSYTSSTNIPINAEINQAIYTIVLSEHTTKQPLTYYRDTNTISPYPSNALRNTILTNRHILELIQQEFIQSNFYNDFQSLISKLKDKSNV